MFYEKQIAVSRIYTNAHIRPIQCARPILLFHCYTTPYIAFFMHLLYANLVS